jgi:DUF1365 family protein
MTLASGIYEGRVHHRRAAPIEHSFSYRIWLPLLDLDELPAALDRHPLWSARRPAPLRFRDSDFLDAGRGSLAARARELAGEPADAQGPVRVLASPRLLGIAYNPVSFLYVHDGAGALAAVIAEVTNTPWGERHRYVARERTRDGSIRQRFEKRLHVSPFMGMDQIYEFEAGVPGKSLSVRISSFEGGRKVFEAGLALRRRELTREAMTTALVRHPPATAATIGRIYWQALRLRLKEPPRHSHAARAG